MAETIRAFYGIPVDAGWRDAIGQLEKSLRTQLPGNPVRWTRPDQLHLTLKFLGSVTAEAIDGLVPALKRACHDRPTLQLKAEGLGCFPDFRRPKIIWMGIGGDIEGLRRLQNHLEQEAGPLSAHQEAREFHAHLTIGRVKTTRPGELRPLGECIQSATVGPLDAWDVREVELIKSELSPQGPQYTTLAAVALGRS